MWDGEDAEEILRMLRASRGQRFSIKDVSRYVDRRRFRDEPMWARHVLTKLADAGKIERDDCGFYLIPKDYDRKKEAA